MKIKDLIKDKWYKLNYSYVFKFEKLENSEELNDNGIFYHDIYSYNFYLNLIEENYFNIEDSFCAIILDFNYPLSEIDITEVIYLLPERHPDRVNFLRKQRIKRLLFL